MGVDADVLSANIGIQSIELGGRPTIVFPGGVSSTRQHSIRGTPLKKKKVVQALLESTIVPGLRRSANFPIADG